MVFVDWRKGSGELIPMLEMLKLPVQKMTLPFADFAFMGNGPGGLPMPVGVERKVLSDWVDSFYSGRFSGHQLPGLLDPEQGYQIVYVVIEGVFRMDQQTGLVQVPGWDKKSKKKWVDFNMGTPGNPKGLMWRELQSGWMTIENKGGMIFRQTSNKAETCKFIATLYNWGTGKEWDAHKSHLRFRTQEADPHLLVKPSLLRQFAATLPGIGWQRSAAVAGHFGNVYDMVQASEKDWQEIDGIGKGMAKKIWYTLRGLSA